jgi:hypothetical protein
MNEQTGASEAIELPSEVGGCFRPGTAFVDASSAIGEPIEGVRVAFLEDSENEPPDLSPETLPLLVLPAGMSVPQVAPDGQRVLVAVEGRDEKIAAALARVLDPERAMLALLHVTWIPGIAGSPLDRAGLDDPHPSDLLAYDGAREALVGTPGDLRRLGFSVTTHLRESRDPAVSIAEFIAQHDVAMFVLGLGRHGAGIGRHVLERVRIPTLFVRAR